MALDKLMEQCLEIERISSRCRELSEKLPRYPFNECVGNIYDICKGFCDAQNKDIKHPWERKKFIFVVLAIISPLDLIRDKVGKKRLTLGVRAVLANLLECRATCISHDLSQLSFLYWTYSNFRNEVAFLYDACMSKLPKTDNMSLDDLKKEDYGT
ncbi:MAG: hypothetical protein K5633_00315 [Paludibacteraceae bacterium]|nr:hypothetical protein [Paludibacteraceae bacterium]